MPSRDPWPDLNKEELRLLNDVANRGQSAISNPKLAFWLKNQATELQVWAYDLGSSRIGTHDGASRQRMSLC